MSRRLNGGNAGAVDEELAAGIKGALSVLGDALRLYGWERCRVSFNGGAAAAQRIVPFCRAPKPLQGSRFGVEPPSQQSLPPAKRPPPVGTTGLRASLNPEP